MLTAENQEKILTALLKRPENQYCSDCNGKSPCWVSLDFGVFVCMNCSGAHRALGPSITRVRSTKLDTWNKDWVQNMKIGNSILNKFWQHQLIELGGNIKPNVNSSLTDIKKYVFDKYVKRKYVDPDEEYDPLTKLKKGIYSFDKPERDDESPSKPVIDNNKGTIKKETISQPVKQIHKKHIYNTVKQSTMPFSRQDIVRKQTQTTNSADLLMFNHPEVKQKESCVNQVKQQKKFDFNFDQVQFDQKPKQKVQEKKKQVTFDNFLINLSSQSESSTTKHQNQPQQPIHGNYFMSPQGFVSNTAQYSHQPHGFSQPSHNPTQQLTMNINMNMYPGVMNINMGQVQPSVPVYPQHQSQFITQQQQFMQPSLHHTNTQPKPFQYNDFFTNGVTPPPNNMNGITLEVTMNNNIQKGNQTSNKEKSWVDDWM